MGRLVGLVAFVFVAGCNGVINEAGSEESSVGPGTVPNPAVCGSDDLQMASIGGLRRLTPQQYEHTVRDLLHDPQATPAIDREEGGTIPSPLAVEKYNTAAEELAARESERSQSIVPCTLDGADDLGCASRFISEFGARAFRRPVAAAEQQWLEGVYADAVASGQAPAQALDIVTKVILQSPQLIYIREYGEEAEGLPPGVYRLTDYERASRLSYFLWGTMPDPELMAAADAGRLGTAEGVRQAAARMLADPRAEGMVEDFFADWLGLNGSELTPTIEAALKNGERFPEDSPALRRAMREELRAFTQRVFFEEDASLRTLLTANYSYVNADLAALYGVDNGLTGDEWGWVDLAPGERAGFLTQSAFLALHAGPLAQSPVNRGVFVIEDVLCHHIGMPPPNANDNAPEGGASSQDGEVVHLTVREELSMRTEAPDCAACHTLINGIGFTFGNYDALGAYQTEHVFVEGDGTEVRLPIDATGELVISDQSGPVDGAVELVGRVAESEDATHCYASRWVREAFGGATTQVPDCLFDAFTESYRETEDTRELLLSVVSSAAFLHVRRVEP